MGINEGAFGPASLKPHRYHFAMRRKDPGLLSRFRSRCARPRAPCVRDGDLIPFSMTTAYFNQDRCIPLPEMRPPAHRCGCATHGQVWASSRPPTHLYGFDATGWWVWASIFCSGSACGQDEGTFGSASLKPDRNLLQSGARILVCCLGTGSGTVCTALVPLALETATWSRSQ